MALDQTRIQAVLALLWMTPLIGEEPLQVVQVLEMRYGATLGKDMFIVY